MQELASIPTPLWIAIAVGTVGCCLLGGAYYAYTRTVDFLSRAQTTRAKILGYVTRYSNEPARSPGEPLGSRTYAPRFSYRVNGKDYEKVSNVSASKERFPVGVEVELLYDRNDPERVKFRGFFDFWGVSMVLGILGTVALVVTTVFVLIGLGILVPEA